MKRREPARIGAPWAPLLLVAFSTGCIPAGVFDAPCQGGRAAGYPCSQLDLGAFLPLSVFGAENASDIWGYRDAESEREFALLGLTTGTAFVEVTDPMAPAYLGHLPAPGLSALTFGQSRWRDIKVMGHTALVVTEAFGSGMQLFDLNELLDVDPQAGPTTFVESAVYGDDAPETVDGSAGPVSGAHPQTPRVPSGLTPARVFNTHNVAVNAETQYAYLVGTNSCNGGLHMVDVSDPTAPVFAGCFDEEAYTHDAQCVVYRGGDPDYNGREICFTLNGQVGDTVTDAEGNTRRFERGDSSLVIVDVTDKSAPRLIKRMDYPGSAYAHQGWLTDDHRFLLSNDELDELEFGHNTSTYVWDLADLDAPVLVGTHEHNTAAIDHNLYIRGNRIFESNYAAGLRVLEPADLMNAELREIAYFDTYPASDEAAFFGAWSSYPYFDSGNIVVSSIDEGLFVLIPQF